MSNINRNKRGGAVVVSSGGHTDVHLKECTFFNNTGIRGAAIYLHMQYPLPPQYNFHCTVNITSGMFDYNLADDSLVYLNVPEGIESKVSVDIYNSSFTNNFGTCMFLQKCALLLSGGVLFENNSAENGGALYIDETCTVGTAQSIQQCHMAERSM